MMKMNEWILLIDGEDNIMVYVVYVVCVNDELTTTPNCEKMPTAQ
jgi:hypothetical protein